MTKIQVDGQMLSGKVFGAKSKMIGGISKHHTLWRQSQQRPQQKLCFRSYMQRYSQKPQTSRVAYTIC